MTLNFLFPKWCIGCRREGTFICPSCFTSLPKITAPLCPKCGRPQASGILCPGCVNWQSDIDGIRSPFRFDGVIRQAVHELKYRNLRALSPELAKLMYDYLISNPVPAESLVPVPLSWKRLKERGYNQSGLLAKELGKLSGLPLVDDCVIRKKNTPPQARTATVSERRQNVADAFACRDDRLKGKKVLLIDDVSTSGATLDACARAIKADGAVSVWGLTLAREI